MYSRYDAIPARLCEYRNQLNKSQEEMSELFMVSQSQYNKLENGNHIISYESLKAFWKSGGDIYFLITGERYQPGILERYTEKCKTSEEKAEILKLLIWTVKQGMRRLEYEIPAELKSMWKYVALAENEYTTENIWLNIRKAEHLSQQKLAKLIDIDVKRYRRLEKLCIDPDADILAVLYQKLQYSPLLFLENQLFYPDVLNRIWNEFPSELQAELEDWMDAGIYVMDPER